MDNFKLYNDTYGHNAGDEALRKVSETTRNCLRRASDTAFRIGGEEFVVLLAEDALESTCQLAERLRQSIEDLNIPHSKNNNIGRLTVSIGIYQCIPDRNSTMDEICIKGDKALYKAKKNSGRNKVVAHVCS